MQARDVLEEIKRQRRLSDQVTAVGFEALREIYYPGVSPAQIRFGEIGSYGRGTNDDPEPDIDVMFLGIPGDARQGFFNWVGRGTAEMAQSPEGLTLLSQVHEYDPKLARAITETIKHVEGHFGCEKQATFNFVRSWAVFPGVIFNISAPIPGYGPLAFDINLYHPTEYFGVEHTRRFIPHLERVRAELGEQTAARLILDIRQVKHRAKEYARDPETGKSTKGKKIWGIVCEALFTCSYPPPSREELLAGMIDMEVESFPSVLPDTDHTFPIQVIDENLSLKDVLDAAWQTRLLHAGNWTILLKAMGS